MNQLHTRRSSHNGVIHQKNIQAGKLALDRVQFESHCLLPLLLPGHDEGAGDVPVLDKALAIGLPESVCALEGRGAGGVWDGDDHMDVMVGNFLHDPFRQSVAHIQTRVVDSHSVHNRVGSREVDVLEETGIQRGGVMADQ